MEPAPEMVVFCEKLLALVWSSHPDVEGHLDGWSRSPGAQFIGPDPDEWIEGFDQLAALSRVQFPEQQDLGGMSFETERALGWREGSVGWVAWRGYVRLGESDPIESRMSFVIHEEGLHLKAVHVHFSFTAHNVDTMGVELTTALDDLLVGIESDAQPPRGVAPDGSVTIVFTDLEDSTSRMEALGESRWLDLLAWHSGVVTQHAATFGGFVVKGQGDGFMLAFPAAGSAVACAMAIERAIHVGWMGVPVAIRIGVHAGNAMFEAGDFFVRTVVVAARIACAATGGEILVSDVVRENLGGAFPLDDPRSHHLKGLSGSYAVFPVLWR
jgi:adenylate cyclase